MDKGGIVIAFSYIFVGLLVIALCVPLAKNKIGMNRWYGIRFRKSFDSDENWYRINKYGSKRMILWSFAIVFVGLGGFFFPDDAAGSFSHAAGGAPLILIIPAIESWLFAKRL